MSNSPLLRHVAPQEKDVMYFECGEWLYRVECIRPMLGSSAPYTYLIGYHPEVPENMPKNPSVVLYWKDCFSYRWTGAPETPEAVLVASGFVDADYRIQRGLDRGRYAESWEPTPYHPDRDTTRQRKAGPDR
jgi:hypothetical protein